MVGVISWVKGYVRIRVWGLSVERFLNLCGHRNILLWDVVRKETHWEMCISVKGFRSLRPIVRKTGTKVAITERSGLPFFVSRMNRKKMFLAGAVISLAFWYGSANFVWRIEIQGNYKITQEQIRDYLDEQNLSIGTRKKSVDIEQLEKDIRMEFPDITWTSGKFEGTSFVLSIKENDGIVQTESLEDDGGYDLISHAEGEICYIVVRSGIPKVKQGDMVSKDMVLVEGKVPVYNDDGTVREYILVKADADIYIKHTITYEESLSETYIKKEYTGREEKNSFLRFGSNELSFHDSDPYCVYDVVMQENTTGLFEDLKIPVSWGKYTYREYMNVECLYSKEEAVDILKEKLLLFLAGLEEKGVQIIEKDVTIVKDDNKYKIMGEILVAEPAKDLKPIELSTEELIQENGE